MRRSRSTSRKTTHTNYDKYLSKQEINFKKEGNEVIPMSFGRIRILGGRGVHKIKKPSKIADMLGISEDQLDMINKMAEKNKNIIYMIKKDYFTKEESDAFIQTTQTTKLVDDYFFKIIARTQSSGPGGRSTEIGKGKEVIKEEKQKETIQKEPKRILKEVKIQEPLQESSAKIIPKVEINAPGRKRKEISIIEGLKKENASIIQPMTKYQRELSAALNENVDMLISETRGTPSPPRSPRERLSDLTDLFPESSSSSAMQSIYYDEDEFQISNEMQRSFYEPNGFVTTSAPVRERIDNVSNRFFVGSKFYPLLSNDKFYGHSIFLNEKLKHMGRRPTQINHEKNLLVKFNQDKKFMRFK